MNETHHIPVLFYIIALFAVAYTIYNSRRILIVLKGQKEVKKPDNFFSQIRDILFFGVGQRRVFSNRFSFAAMMHFFLGWGFFELLFATTVDFLTARGLFLHYLPGLDTPWFAALNDLGGVMLFTGLIMALYRRWHDKPELLPNSFLHSRGNSFGDIGILLFLLLLVIGGFLTEAGRLAVNQPETAAFSLVGYPISKVFSLQLWQSLKTPLWWFHAGTSLLFIALLPQTKMLHTIAVFLNIASTNRARRGEIRTMHVSKIMEDPDIDFENISLGVSKVEEFTWKQLLDSVSCTECSRCTSVCPAAQSGMSLSPMKIITDIRHNLFDKFINSNEPDNLVGRQISQTELWSCTTCGACMDICPVLIDHVPTFTDMRRYLVLSEGLPPEKAGESLENINQNGNPWGLPRNDRLKWAIDAGLNLPVFSDKKSAEYLYWVGCAGAYDPRNQEVSRAMVGIMNSAGLDFAVLGNEENCTGDSARRLGEEYTYETMALQNIETLEKYDFANIVTQCPHCFHTLKNEYRDFGSRFKVMHHTELIDSLIGTNQISVNHSNGKVLTYHDPCYLGRYNKIYAPPRDILSRTLGSNDIREMDNNRNQSFCCGAGGGNMWHEIDEGERINVNRFREAAQTGADTVITACSFCLIMMDDAMRVEGKEDTMQILDIAEVVNQQIQ